MKKFGLLLVVLFLMTFPIVGETLSDFSKGYLSAGQYNQLLAGEVISNTIGSRSPFKLIPPGQWKGTIEDSVSIRRGDIAMEFLFFVPFTNEVQEDPLWLLNQYIQVDQMTSAEFYGSRSGDLSRLIYSASRVDSPSTLNPLPNLYFDAVPENFSMYLDLDMNKIGQMVIDLQGTVADDQVYISMKNTNTIKYSKFQFLKPENFRMHMISIPLDDGVLLYNAAFCISPKTRFLSFVGLSGPVDLALKVRVEGLSEWFRSRIEVE